MKIYHTTAVLSKYIDFARVPNLRLYEASQRGKIVHAACIAFALGGYVAPLPGVYAGYFKSFKRWFGQYVQRVILAEQTFESKAFGFTGRPDLVVELFNGLFLLVDLKTPINHQKSWAVQLASYWYLLDDAGIRIDSAASLRLRPNGGEAIANRYDDWPRDFDIFLSALNAHRALTA